MSRAVERLVRTPQHFGGQTRSGALECQIKQVLAAVDPSENFVS